MQQLPANVHVSNHPLMAHKLSLLRDKSTEPKKFRELVRELSWLLGYEAMADLSVQPREVETPLERVTGAELEPKVGLVPVLRAGLGMVDAMLELMPSAEVWHIGLYRDERTLKPVEYYNKLPDAATVQVCLILDPMLATGGKSDKRFFGFRFGLTLFPRAKHTCGMQIHIARDGKQLGHFSLEEINRQLAAGTLSLSDNAWYEGASGWAPLSTVPGVTPGAASPAATTPAAATPRVAPAPTAAASAPVGPTTVVVAAPTEPLAIWSLVLSLVGLLGFCCGVTFSIKPGEILGIAGVVCGHLGLSKINANPQLQGRGLAMAGLIIGYLAVVSWALYLLFFGGLAALTSMMEAAGK